MTILILILHFLVFVFILIGARIPRLFSLRKDMINENYVTYTGEFYCYETTGKSSTEYVRFQNADGEQIEVEESVLRSKVINDLGICPE